MQSLWMLVASFLFSIMGVCVKLASDRYSTAEIVAYRGVIGMGMILVLIYLQRGTLRTRYPYMHLWRGTVGVAALWMWFYAISRLPLAMAVTLNYMSPVWIAIFLFAAGWAKAKKRLEWGLVLAIALGFAGVVLLLRPSMHADQLLGGLIGLGSGMLAALAYIQVREMGLLGEPEYRVVFYFSATCAVAGVLGALLGGGADALPVSNALNPANAANAAGSFAGWTHHDSRGMLLLLIIGLTAASAQIAMTRAYRLGNTLVVANLQYVGIVFSSGWDVLFWGNALTWTSWLGIAVILSSGLLATFYNARNNKPPIPAALAPSEADPIAAEQP